MISKGLQVDDTVYISHTDIYVLIVFDSNCKKCSRKVEVKIYIKQKKIKN